MNRHVADKRSRSDGGRVRNFAKVERAHAEVGSHPAARAVHERPQTRSDAARLKAFTRIERGVEA
ncbi:MAG: hypothetical protein H6895_04695 [Defluviimonas sp.]|uniref:hypothetical protein n=1 Tax=Albidovulum sp. TaxID=1872424 RepID=UPI002A322EFB|nr:hypothetical protein [Defluviimonas sp.]